MTFKSFKYVFHQTRLLETSYLHIIKKSLNVTKLRKEIFNHYVD